MHSQTNIKFAHSYCYSAITFTTKSYMFMFWASLAHHQGALQEVICWCTLCM